MESPAFIKFPSSTFPWHLDYDEMEYIVSGSLTIHTEQGQATGNSGDVLFIPKGSQIKFSAPQYAKFLYFTCPADWQNA